MHRLFACLWLLAPVSAFAGEVLIYRCTDAGGGLTVQNMPCPKGSRQEVKRMQAIATVPMATPATPITPTPEPEPPVPPLPAAAAPLPSEPEPKPESGGDAPRLPPPNLFRCTTYDGGSYLTEDSEPASRCVPLRTVGLDGNPQTGAGEACEVMRDRCARVPDEALCEAWRKRYDEAEVAWRFTRPETEQRNKTEFERMQRILDESACGR